MKASHSFSLEVEVIKKLKEMKNPSTIVNDFLKEYFYPSDQMKEEQMKEELNIIKKERKKIDEREIDLTESLNKIQMKDKEMRDTFKDIPQKILKDFNKFDSMDEHTLFDRFKDIYSKTYEIKWEEVLKAFKEFNGKEK